MDYLKIRNWDKWQCYRKDRGQPPWIKIHRRVMRNPEWVSLSDAERGQLVAIWLLAADHDGVIPASSEVIQKLCYLTNPPDLNKFTDLGFIENGWRQLGVNLASSGCQRDQPKAKAEAEKIREEKKHTQAKIPFKLPDWFPPEVWSVFLSHRKAAKAPVVEKAYPVFIEKFLRLKAKGWHPKDVVDVMVEKGWRWFKPEWVEKDIPGVSTQNAKTLRACAEFAKEDENEEQEKTR